MDTFAEMTIPDYVAFGVLIVLFVVNVLAAFADRDSANRDVHAAKSALEARDRHAARSLKSELQS